MITANKHQVRFVGDTFDIGMCLTAIIGKIIDEYGLEQGTKIVDEAYGLALGKPS